MTRYYTCGQECTDRFNKFILQIQSTFVEKIKVLNNKNSLKRIFVKELIDELLFYLVIDNLDNDLEYWINIQMNLPNDPDFKGSGLQIQIGSEKDYENRRFKHNWEEIKFT